MIVKKDGYVFDIDIQATRNYYKANKCCDCLPCQNFCAQAKDKFKKLDEFLSIFGVDISRPDKTSWLETEEYIDYIDITYTVCGKILKSDGYEIDIYDSLFLCAYIDNEYVPNNHKNEEWFSITIFNVKLPWIIEK